MNLTHLGNVKRRWWSNCRSGKGSGKDGKVWRRQVRVAPASTFGDPQVDIEIMMMGGDAIRLTLSSGATLRTIQK